MKKYHDYVFVITFKFFDGLLNSEVCVVINCLTSQYIGLYDVNNGFVTVSLFQRCSRKNK